MNQVFLTTLALTLALAIYAPKSELQQCKNFIFQEDAQAHYEKTGDRTLDTDQDGIACEALPRKHLLSHNPLRVK